MAHYDAETNSIVQWPSRAAEHYPGWDEVDCGCCMGLEWGGWTPRECRDCGGNGVLYLHRASRVLAWYPGGPLRGRMPQARAA